MSDSSEEKTHEPSARKLNDARKKGQVASSRGPVEAASTIVGLVFLWVMTAQIWRDSRAMLDMALDTPMANNANVDVARLASNMGSHALGIIGPLIGLMMVSAVLMSIVVNRGIPFALDPIKPNFQSIDPIKGFGKLFTARNFIEVGKSILKVSVILIVTGMTIYAALRTLMILPTCGMDCAVALMKDRVRPILFTAVGAFLVVGVVDILIQRWLFRRDMKMTRSDVKRENKEDTGDPHIRQARMKERREVAAGMVTQLGVRAATVFVFGPTGIVGIRYVPGKTPLPIIVCAGRGRKGAELARAAKELDTPKVRDPKLVEDMLAVSRKGQPVRKEFYEAVGRVLITSGAVS